jgi:3-dehydroquinate synthase class II
VALGGPPAAGDLQKYLDAQPPGKTSLLAELRREPDVVSVLQGTRTPGQRRSNEAPQYALSTTTLMLVRGKALNLSVYTLYENAADLDWVRATTARWIDEIARLNNR